MEPPEQAQALSGAVPIVAPMPAGPAPGTGGQTPCRFGFGCRRGNCYFVHPEGRAIDGAPGAPPAMAPMMPGGFVPRSGPPPMGGMQAFPPMGGAPPPMGPPPTGAPPTSGGKKVCRFAHGCTRADCYFAHPDGRAIDNGGAKGPPSPGGNFGPPRRGPPMGGRGTHRQPQPKETEEMIKKDTWYAHARNCTCCKGFVFGCKVEECEKRGECGCSAAPAVLATETTATEGEAKDAAASTGEGADKVDTLSDATANLKVSE